MDIRHCFVPYLPGILEKDTILKNGIKNDGENDKIVIESEEGIMMKTKDGEKREKDNAEKEVENRVKYEVEKEVGSGVEEIDRGFEECIEIGVEKEKMQGVENGVEKGVAEEVEKSVVIMAKHLCGVATDLALRSLEAFIIPTSTSTSSSGEHQDGKLLLKTITER